MIYSIFQALDSFDKYIQDVCFEAQVSFSVAPSQTTDEDAVGGRSEIH